jgi:hypothetical protein
MHSGVEPGGTTDPTLAPAGTAAPPAWDRAEVVSAAVEEEVPEVAEVGGADRHHVSERKREHEYASQISEWNGYLDS